MLNIISTKTKITTATATHKLMVMLVKESPVEDSPVKESLVKESPLKDIDHSTLTVIMATARRKINTKRLEMRKMMVGLEMVMSSLSLIL